VWCRRARFFNIQTEYSGGEVTVITIGIGKLIITKKYIFNEKVTSGNR